MLNKQQPFGGDVITRISATMMDPDALGRLQRAGRTTTLDRARRRGVRRGRRRPGEVYEVALAGNATMTALALGIDPEPLGVAPFVMSTAHAADRARRRPRPARCTRGRARSCFPALGAYVGGDIVAGHARHRAWTATSGPGCSSTSAPTARSCSATATGSSSTAAPAGPAFEGGAIRCGMRAADGADRGRQASATTDVAAAGHRRRRAARAVRVRPRRRRRRAGRGRACSTPRGRFDPDDVAAEIAPGPGRPAAPGRQGAGVRAAPPAPRRRPGGVASYLSQRDVRELQFAKAAIATGWTLLLEELGLEHARRPAGAAGRLVRQLPRPRRRPCGSGWCPKLPVLRIVSAGNVAGEGAKMALLSIRERAGARPCWRR